MNLCAVLEAGIEVVIHVVKEREEMGRWEIVNESRERLELEEKNRLRERLEYKKESR